MPSSVVTSLACGHRSRYALLLLGQGPKHGGRNTFFLPITLLHISLGVPEVAKLHDLLSFYCFFQQNHFGVPAACFVASPAEHVPLWNVLRSHHALIYFSGFEALVLLASRLIWCICLRVLQHPAISFPEWRQCYHQP